MRNLKKVLSLIVVVAMLLTAMVPAFAAGTASVSADAQACAEIGMLLGDGNGVTSEYTATTLTRVQAAVLLLRLKGVSEEAANFAGTDNFADVDASAWFAPYTAYLKAHPEFGFIGDGVNFNAEEKISAQQYYKVILTALGFEEGEGKDYVYADTLTFAASKGLVKVTGEELTVDDLAVATVEGLKATVKDSTKALATTLVEAGKINADKAEAAGVYAKVTQGFELAYGARSITVKFNIVPADASKVAITVTRDAGLAVDAKFTQDADDKTVFTYASSSNLTLGEFKVSVKDDAADLGSKTITVEEEKIKSIEITSSQIIRTSDYEGYVKYKVLNNYGEDVTKEGIASSIEWKTSLPDEGTNPESNKGTITITYGDTNETSYLSRLRDYTTTPIVVTGYDKDSAVTVTKNLSASATIGDIASIKLLSVKNDDGKTTIYRGDATNVFYIDYEIKDSNGELITNYDLLGNEDALRVYPNYDDGNPVIAAVEIIPDPSSTDDALFQIKLKENFDQDNQYDGVGTQPINFVAVQTGKSASINVKVEAATDELASFVLQRPSTSVVANSGWVEIPYLAYDASGNTMTSYTQINSYVKFTPEENVRTTYDSNGNFKLYFNTSDYAADRTVTLTATVQRNFKYSSISMTMKTSSTPDEIVAVNLDTVNLTPSAAYDFDLSKFTVEDKNGNVVSLMTDKANYYVKAESNNVNVITVDPAKTYAIGDQKINLIGGTTTGSTSVLFKLMGPDGTDAGTEDDVIATKSVTFRNVATKDIASFGIESIGKIYGIYDASFVRQDDTFLDDENNAFRAEIKVRGYLANGQKVYLPYVGSPVTAAAAKVAVDTSSFTVSDTTNFEVADTKYVYATDLDDDRSATLSATVLIDGSPRNVSTALTSTYAEAVATKITAVANKAYLSSTRTVQRSTYYTAPVKDKGGDFYEVAAEDFDIAFTDLNSLGTAKELVKFSSNGDDGAQTRAGLYFLVTDSYGKEGLIPSITVLSCTTVTEGSGNAAVTYNKYVMSGNSLTLNRTYTPAEGDEIRLMASLNGVTKTITIQVK